MILEKFWFILAARVSTKGGGGEKKRRKGEDYDSKKKAIKRGKQERKDERRKKTRDCFNGGKSKKHKNLLRFKRPKQPRMSRLLLSTVQVGALWHVREKNESWGDYVKQGQLGRKGEPFWPKKTRNS